MNILFISDLSGRISAGPSWSVPARIKAQEKLDNVLWVNISNTEMPHWKTIPAFHKLNEFGKLQLNSFPEPFNNPDIVVCENFYSMDEVRFAKELRRKRIPYVVVPRGSLTIVSRNNKKKIKKFIAHKLWFDQYVRKAAAVQFLTENEKENSIPKDVNSFVLPNGFSAPKIRKALFSNECIKCVFIGRINIYQKGLDLLLQAIIQKQNELRNNHIVFDIYGPKKEDYDMFSVQIKNGAVSDLVFLKGEINGIAKENALLDSDVFLLTSRSEGHPMGLVEALSYGLPCLVSKGSNMKKEIEMSNSGWTCEGDSVDSIVKALESMIKEKEDFQKKSQNAIQLATNYEWDKLAEEFHQELLKLL